MASNESYIQIKPNVYKWTLDGREYSVKKYDSLDMAYKIGKIHTKLTAISYPYSLPVYDVDEEGTIVQPWVTHAKSSDFSNEVDRELTLLALQTLHQTKLYINWEEKPYLKDYNIVGKWVERLKRFEKLESSITPMIGKKNFDQILFYAENALYKIKDMPRWSKSKTLLHGDVVHHNFLKQGSKVFLIDFDLACLGHEEAEIALWMHRVLPNIEYDVHFLMDEQPSLKKYEPDYLLYLLYPNELLREWLYIMGLPNNKKRQLVPKMRVFTAKALTYWPKMWYDIEKIIKKSN